jgi:2'-hydroxyisoflavone reductase
MRILVIGGTRFVGRHLVDAAVRAGHEVTVFHRGRSLAPADRPDVTHRLGDRDGDLTALAGGEWDATVDTCAYVPRQVHGLADALDGRGGRVLLVSSVSAYAEPGRPGFTEDAPLAELADPGTEEVTGETYGGLKVRCEQAATERFGPGTLLVRPTYVVGPDDYTWRFPWWVTRLARGGEVLAPGPPGSAIQVIDVRDLAAWMVGLLEAGRSGAFHAASPPPPFSWGDLLEAVAAAAAPPGTRLTWVDPQVLHGAGLDGAALPLWSEGDPDAVMLAADPAAATRSGLAPRPLADTVADTLGWARSSGPPRDHPGLSPEREREVLHEWHARAAAAPER